jgi:hypothetical protein
LGPVTVTVIFEVQSDGVDHVLGVPRRWVGYALPEPDTLLYARNENICFWVAR